MFNSFVFGQGSSAKRIPFEYTLSTSGSSFVMNVTTNLSGINRRPRLFDGVKDTWAGEGLYFINSTGGTASLIFDRDNELKTLSINSTGSSDSIIGVVDLSSQKRIRSTFSMKNHSSLTEVLFPENVDVEAFGALSAFTSFNIDNNDLRRLDLSGLTNLGGSLLFGDNLNLSAATFPATQNSLGMNGRNTAISSLTLTGITKLNSCDMSPCVNLTTVDFPSNITSVATGSWYFGVCPIRDLDFSVMGPNFGGRIRIGQSTALTGVTFPTTSNSITQFRLIGPVNFPSGYNLDLSPMTNISGQLWLQSFSVDEIQMPTSSANISYLYITGLGGVNNLALSGLSNISSQFWCFNSSMTGITFGSSSSNINQTYLFGLQVSELNISGYTGIGGSLLLRDNIYLENINLPTTNRTITTLSLSGNPLLDYVDLKPISGGSNNNIIIGGNNNSSWTTDISNHILHDLDNFGWTNGILTMSGTTSGYDTSSGGYNGFTHYTNLVGKGWAITMSGLTS